MRVIGEDPGPVRPPLIDLSRRGARHARQAACTTPSTGAGISAGLRRQGTLPSVSLDISSRGAMDTTVKCPSAASATAGSSYRGIALGTMMFGARTEEPEAREIIAAAADAGVNFIDTADTYARGPLGGDHRPRDRRATAIARCWRPSSPTRRGRGRTSAACRASGSWRRRERSLKRLRPTSSTSSTCTRRTPDAAGGDGPRHRRPAARRRDPLFRRLQLQGLADRAHLRDLRRGRHRPAGRLPAALPRAEPHRGGRGAARLRGARHRRRQLQPDGARRALRQIREGRPAAGRKPRRRAEPADDADRITSRQLSMPPPRSPRMRARAASSPPPSPPPGCSPTPSSPPRSPARARWSNGRAIWRRSTSPGRPRTKRWSTSWFRPGTTAVHQFIDPIYPVEGRPAH